MATCVMTWTRSTVSVVVRKLVKADDSVTMELTHTVAVTKDTCRETVLISQGKFIRLHSFTKSDVGNLEFELEYRLQDRTSRSYCKTNGTYYPSRLDLMKSL